MDINIENINTEEFRQDLTKALAKSAIGDMLMKVIEGAATDYKVKQMIEDVVRNHIRGVAQDVLMTDEALKGKMELAVRAAMTDELLEKLVGKIGVERGY